MEYKKVLLAGAGARIYGRELIANELYTLKEFEKLKLGVKPDYFESVNVSKNETFFISGARFESKISYAAPLKFEKNGTILYLAKVCNYCTLYQVGTCKDNVCENTQHFPTKAKAIVYFNQLKKEL